jgi:hypothetical protein
MSAVLAGLVVLVIGDSHMVTRDYLVTTLHDDLVEQGATVDTYGACGANAEDWVVKSMVTCGRAERHGKAAPIIDRSPKAPTWTISELLERHHPNLVVIVIGDTMAGYGQPSLPKSWIYGQVRSLTGKIKAQNVGCAWVGPPWGSEGSSYHKTFDRVREMSEFLAQSVAPCSFIDSTKFSKPGEWPTIDGQHLTATGYRAWGKDISDSIVRLAEQQPLRR